MTRAGARWRQKGHYVAALLAYLALTLLMLAPALPAIAQALPGGPVARRDAWQNVWNLWWVERALSQWRSPFLTPLLYYPTGADLALQTLNVTNGVLVAPVTALWGPVAGYNVAVVAAFALAGLGAYALGLRVSGSRAAAFVAGLLFTFSPFHMTKLWDGQLELIALQWLPLYALFLLRAAEEARLADALLAGVLLALIGYTSWYYFLFFAVYSALFAALWLAGPRAAGAPGRLRVLGRLVVVGALGAALLLPVLLPALRAIGVGAEGGDDSGPNAVSYLKVIHSADLIDFWLPSALNPLWGPVVARIGERVHPYIAAWNIALGYVALALAGAALALRWRAAWRWAGIALAAIVLALGPVLQIGGANTGVLLPYAWLTHLPGGDIAHRPSHFVVLAVLALVPLAALGLAALLRSLAAWRVPLLALTCALALLELAPPAWTLARSEPPALYRDLAGRRGALVDLPPRLESSEPLEAQIVHGMPIMGGFVSRTPDYPFADDTPVVRDLWAMRPGEQRQIPSGDDDALAVLNAYGLRYVVIHQDALSPAQRRSLADVLAQALPGVAPFYDDGRLMAYQVPEAPARPLAFFRDGWYPEERQGDRRWRWMGPRGEVVLVNPTGAPAEARLTLTAQSYDGPRDVALAFGGRPAGSWRVARGDTELAVRVLLPPGESVLTLSAPVTSEAGRSQRSLSIVVVAATLR